jgi:hypothetical protein
MPPPADVRTAEFSCVLTAKPVKDENVYAALLARCSEEHPRIKRVRRWSRGTIVDTHAENVMARYLVGGHSYTRSLAHGSGGMLFLYGPYVVKVTVSPWVPPAALRDGRCIAAVCAFSLRATGRLQIMVAMDHDAFALSNRIEREKRLPDAAGDARFGIARAQFDRFLACGARELLNNSVVMTDVKLENILASAHDDGGGCFVFGDLESMEELMAEDWDRINVHRVTFECHKKAIRSRRFDVLGMLFGTCCTGIDFGNSYVDARAIANIDKAFAPHQPATFSAAHPFVKDVRAKAPLRPRCVWSRALLQTADAAHPWGKDKLKDRAVAVAILDQAIRDLPPHAHAPT